MEEFEALLAASRTAVERWVRARIANRADAEDVLQEIFLAAYRGFPGLRDRAAFLPWLLGIARRKYADWCRARVRQPETPMANLPEPKPDAPDTLAVEETLETLSSRDRLMLQLFYRDRLPQKQIAARLRIPEGTVKSRMNTARAHFRAAYPYPPKGAITMKKGSLPTTLPEYSVTWREEAPFPVECRELTGWFVVPRPGERLTWGMYDLPSRKLDLAYVMTVLGPASVHGLEGVAIRATVLEAAPADDDPMRDAVEASTGGREEWIFIAQEKDGYTRFLSAEHREGDVRTLTTFLDGEAFMDNWGFGEDNCGTPIRRRAQGKILRSGATVTAAEACIDVVGCSELTLDGKRYDTVCVMDLGMYEAGVVSEQYLDREGRTVLWRRFNRDDWALDRYGKRWSELLPGNEQLTVNGQRYVHWYDCLCQRPE